MSKDIYKRCSQCFNLRNKNLAPDCPICAYGNIATIRKKRDVKKHKSPKVKGKCQYCDKVLPRFRVTCTGCKIKNASKRAKNKLKS